MFCGIHVMPQNQLIMREVSFLTAKRMPLGKYLKYTTHSFFERLKSYEPPQRAVLLLLLLSFINAVTAVIGAIVIGVYLLAQKDVAAEIFRTGGNGLLFLLFAMSTVIAAINRNLLGLIAGIFVFFIAVTALYFKNNITPQLFEDFITIYLGYSVVAALYAAVEYVIGRLGDTEYRCASTFINPLYYSFFITFAVLFCTYRIVTPRSYRRIYVPVLIINAIGMILSGSRMPWVGMFVGLFLILLLRRQYKLIAVFAVFIMGLLLLFVLFPDISFFTGMRLNKIDVSYTGRKPYWDLAVRGIFDKPLFGHGLVGFLDGTIKSDSEFMSRFADFNGSLNDMFVNMKGHGWKTHAHNILLEALYSFGIIGTLIFCTYMMKIGLRFFRNCGYSSQNPHFALLCGVVVSICVNGLVDCEVVGLQTPVFTLLIFAMTGLYSGDNDSDGLYKLEPNGDSSGNFG